MKSKPQSKNPLNLWSSALCINTAEVHSLMRQLALSGDSSSYHKGLHALGKNLQLPTEFVSVPGISTLTPPFQNPTSFSDCMSFITANHIPNRPQAPEGNSLPPSLKLVPRQATESA